MANIRGWTPETQQYTLIIRPQTGQGPYSEQYLEPIQHCTKGETGCKLVFLILGDNLTSNLIAIAVSV